MAATANKVLGLLEELGGEYLSGEDIGTKLGISRSAVWKAVTTLKREGYDIVSVTNKGYALSPKSDVLSADGINKYLADADKFNIVTLKETVSTNDVAKQMALDKSEEFTVVVADRQTAGRGRNGRKFFSPEKSGVYMSVILRPKSNAFTPAYITCTSAVAVAKAIEDNIGRDVDIKWVNDLFLDGKKICGILTEGAYSFEDERLEYAIVGIGVNVTAPSGGFDKSISDIAGAICSDTAMLRNKLIADILSYMYRYFSVFDYEDVLEEYKKRMRSIGRYASVTEGGNIYDAKIIALGDEFELIVENKNGERKTLRFGEISLKLKKQKETL